jgi:hypothetical protein
MLRWLGYEAADLAKRMFNLMFVLLVAGGLYAVTQNATVAAVAAIILFWAIEAIMKNRAARKRIRK